MLALRIAARASPRALLRRLPRLPRTPLSTSYPHATTAATLS